MVDFKVNFREVHLLKGYRFGIGTYGAVFKAKCDNLTCAAKILHPTLFDPTMQHQIAAERSRVAPIRKFEQECEFLSTIRHPNVVQYLGLSEDPDTGLPVLLMELMDENLSHFLHERDQPIPFRIQVNICHDIALALSFLHSNNIIHRDLSSNNVLLIGDVKAKITDFGMATYASSQLTFTRSPGADVYMPPEAVWKDSPTYTEKVDCFSFGVIVVQILTRLPPRPGDRLKEVEISNQKVDIRVPELERRCDHINEVDSNHLLLPIALDCLKDKGIDRPSAKQLCERISVIKERPECKENIIIKDGVSERELKEQIKSLQLKLESFQQQETHELKQQLEQMADKIREKDRIIKEIEAKLGYANQQLAMTEHVRAKFERQFRDFDQQLSQIQKSRAIKLKWSEGERAPDKIIRWSNAVTRGSTVYVKFAGSTTIFQYNEGWSRLPDCPIGLCSLAVVNGLLTTIGGYRDNDYSNKLFSFENIVEKGGTTGRWMEKFPPMPTKRNQATSLCISGMALIVAGGRGKDDVMLKTVEVLNTETLQWSAATDLLERQENASLSVCGDYLYMLGGLCGGAIIKSVYSYPLSAIFQRNPKEHWKKVADLPYPSATSVSLCGHLLAIGGRESDSYSTCVRAVQMYNQITDSWEEISYMSIGRSRCFAAVLPANRLFVVGGWTGTKQGDRTDRVEIATLF